MTEFVAGSHRTPHSTKIDDVLEAHSHREICDMYIFYSYHMLQRYKKKLSLQKKVKFMLGWVIYSVASTKNHAFDWFCDVASEFGIELKLFFDDDFIVEHGDVVVRGCEDVELPDFALVRGYHIELSRLLESRGVKVFNSAESMRVSEDKMLCYDRFELEGLPQPTTFLNISSYAVAAKLLSSECFILKSCVGSKGEKVWLVSDEKEFDDAVVSSQGDYVVQHFIRESVGRDIRVWVVGDRVAAAVERYNKDSFKSNIFGGGKATQWEVSKELAELCVTAAKSIGLDFAGVDILCSTDKKASTPYYICEINGNAGFRSAASTGQADRLLRDMFLYIFDTVHA